MTEFLADYGLFLLKALTIVAAIVVVRAKMPKGRNRNLTVAGLVLVGYVVTRILVLGSSYLAAVALLPEILRSQLAIPFYFGGTSVLIVVSVTMDTINQVQSHLLAHQYEGLIEKSQLRGKGKKRGKKGPSRR